MNDQSHPQFKEPYKPFVKRFTDSTSNIWAENRVLRFLSVCVLAASVVFGFLVLEAMDRVKTIVVPFGQGVEHMYLVGDQPSEGYLVAITRNVVQLVGTYTASGVEFQLDEVLKLVHPARHADKREFFRREVERLANFSDVSFATYILYDQGVRFGEGTVEVPVRRDRFIGKSRTKDRGFYRIDYVIEEGRFWLTDIKFQRKGEISHEQIES